MLPYIDQLCELPPTLYHLAAGASWLAIQQHGLLSSNEIYRKFHLGTKRIKEIEKDRLGGSYLLDSPEHGSFLLRDRTTLTHKGLEKALEGCSCTPDEWIDLLSQRVFFFAQEKSLNNLMRAPANAGSTHLVLEVDTRKLFDMHAESIRVADINTGYTMRVPAKRSPATFQEPHRYVRNGSRRIVEVTVLDSVPKLLPLLQRATLRRPDRTEELLYPS